MTTPRHTRRWFHLTPDRLIVGLLAVEAVLFFSEHWFPKGWAVLIAVAAIGLALLLMLLWFIVAVVFRWRFQFSIRSLLVLMVVVALPCSWLSWEMKKANEQKEEVAVIEQAGRVLYAYELDEAGNEINAIGPLRQAWLRQLCGDDFFRSVAAIELPSLEVADKELNCVKEMSHLRRLSLDGTQVTDAGLEGLKLLTKLRWLDLNDTNITGTGLQYLKGMSQLEVLDLSGTQITDDGLNYLQGLTTLCKLDLARTQVTDKGLVHLEGLTRLRSLELGYTQVTGKCATRLGQVLSGCKIIGGAEAHDTLGSAFLEKKKYNEAIVEYNEALAFDPDYFYAYINRGIAWHDMGRNDNALADYNQGIKLSPDSAASYNNRGIVWCEKKEYAKALADYDLAIKLDPRCVSAYSNRGIVWHETKQYAKALADYDLAMKLGPDFTDGCNNLAFLQATCPDQRYRNGKKAVENATRACKLSEWKDWYSVCTLGEAYAENGEFQKARESMAKALELATKEEDKKACRERLALFKQNKPYREALPQRKR